MKKLFLLAVAAVLAASIAPVDAQNEALLKVGCQDEFKTLDIWKTTGTWRIHAVNWFYPTLYHKNLVRLAVDELKGSSPNSLPCMFSLRDDVAWDERYPSTAYNFEFSCIGLIRDGSVQGGEPAEHCKELAGEVRNLSTGTAQFSQYVRKFVDLAKTETSSSVQDASGLVRDASGLVRDG